MKRFRATKLKLTSAAANDLHRMRLKQGDLHIILSLGQKLDCADLVLHVFEASCFPAHKRLERLDQLILVIKEGEIVAVCKNLSEVIHRSKQHDRK